MKPTSKDSIVDGFSFDSMLSVKTHEEFVSDLLCWAHALRMKIMQPLQGQTIERLESQLRTVCLLLKKEQNRSKEQKRS